MSDSLHNVDAEEQTIGAMLAYEPAVVAVVEGADLETDDFYLDRNRVIFTALTEIHRSGRPIDPLIAVEALRDIGKLDLAGGENYIARLAEQVNAPGNALHHAEIVRRRSIERATTLVSDELKSGEIDGAQAISRLQDLAARSAAVSGQDSRIRRGGDYLLDVPERSEPIWGSGDQVLCARGESLILTGPQGVGKTTLAQQFTLARAGIGSAKLLGLPVDVDQRPVLYVAADRPEQARRSFARMVSPEDREALNSSVLVWRGPPPVNVVDDPQSLLRWIETLKVGTVVFDSLKDLAIGLADDSVGAAVNSAVQHVLAAGREFVGLQHQRKGQDGRKPQSIDDVYGSTWITAGAGSVVLLWAKPGDSYVELTHLKQPISEVGPMEIHHDHDRGSTTVPEPRDLVEMALHGTTVKNAAGKLYGTDAPDRNQIERARRKLEKLASQGTLTRHDPGGGNPVTFTTCDDCRVTPRDPQRDPLTNESREVTQTDDLASQLVTDMVTEAHAANGRPSAPLKGAANPDRDLSPEVNP